MITGKQWQHIQRQWYFAEGFRFLCDGYRLTLRRIVLRGGRIAYSVYINGEMCARHLTQDCEERRRFLRGGEKLLHSPQERRIERRGGRKLYHAPRYVQYYPYWRSVTAFRRHLRTNNIEIELIGDTQ